MIAESPYIVLLSGTAASLGCSTLAGNLAVYLKALSEDLPVAHVSFDPAAQGAAMFALTQAAGRSLSELQAGVALQELLTLGEFGVEYCAAAADEPFFAQPTALRKGLARSEYRGILILDVPSGQPARQAALAAADLVLIPVKDPADLPEIMRLRQQLLASGGVAEQLWLLPSQLGVAGGYREQLALDEFLRCAAEERDFQVLGRTFRAESQVHEKAAQLSKPVLTRVPDSESHQYLRQLAELVLEKCQQQEGFPVRLRRWFEDGLLPKHLHRVEMNCPLCQKNVVDGGIYYLEAFPARRRLLLHQDCLALLLEGTAAADFFTAQGVLLLRAGEATGGTAGQLNLQSFDGDLELLGSEFLTVTGTSDWDVLTLAASGRCQAEWYRELAWLTGPLTLSELLRPECPSRLAEKRSQLRQFCRLENI